MSTATVAGQPVQSFTYDAVGNMLSKTGVGTGNYVYPAPGSARPHAVKSIPGIGDFQYNANGNLLSGANRTVSWTSFDMPRTISKGNVSSTFMYGPDHQRARQERSDGTTTYYAGPMEVEIHNGAAKVKTYWPMGLGVEIDQPAGATELNWTHLDRLGSVVAISDANGVLKEKLAYDSWGKRRTLNGEAIPDELDGVTDNRGFTGHEMLDKLDLVHMNGRVYDPLVARFMSADPLIQDPEHSQSYNRYTYVWNNPTNLTDPTGFQAMQTNFDRANNEQIQECARKTGCQVVDGVPTATDSHGSPDGTKPVNSADDSANKNRDRPSANSTSGAKPVGDGCDPGMQCISVVGKRDTTSPWELGVEWLTGTGPRQRTFTDGDPFAEMLRKHRHIQSVIQGVKSGELGPKGRANYSVSGWKGVPLYLHDYSNLLTGGNTGNLAVTFLGSYGLGYEVNKGILTMTITNNSTIASATHPPVLGYTPWWRQNVEPTLNRQFESGPLSKISQTVILHERIGGDGK